METAVLAALITSGISLSIGLLNWTNQKRIEQFKHDLDFEKVRFNKLFEVKELVVDLAIENISIFRTMQDLKDRIKIHGDIEMLDCSTLEQFREPQRIILFNANKIYRYNKNLLNKDLRKELDVTVKILETEISISTLTAEEDFTQRFMYDVLMERFNLLAKFLPEFEDSIEKQLDLILSYIHGDTDPSILTFVNTSRKRNKQLHF